MSRNRVTRPFLLCLLVLMGTLISGCPKKPDVPVEPPVEVKPQLEIQRVNPSTGRSDQATSITITGSAFPQGARVAIGDTLATDVVVASDKEIRATVPSGLEPAAYDVVVTDPNPEATKHQARLRGGFTVQPPPRAPEPRADCELTKVYFDFDMSTLTDEARSILQKDVECLKNKRAKRVKVEGHTDERGSTDYNLALGQRRADEVKRYLVQLGVSSVESISYGEERPAVEGSDEGAWSQNRRADILITD